MPDWDVYDPQLRQLHAESVSQVMIAKRLGLPRQTVRDRLKKLGLPATNPKPSISPPQEKAMPEESVQVLPGQISIEDTDTPPVVQYGAVHEFERLPDGYAEEIQPMRPYSEAEEFALDESIRLFGFQGAIVRDQYGRILDGHHRQRVARLRGLGVPHTITHVTNDAHALAIATSLNAVRRQYPRKEREQIALAMRDQGFSYRVIAAALGVSKDTVQRDILGGFKIIPAPEPETEPVSHETPGPWVTVPPVASETAAAVSDNLPVASETPAQRPQHQPERIRGRDKKSYPAQRPRANKPETPGVLTPETPADNGGTVASRWYDRLLSGLNRLDREVDQFQSDGGVSVLGRQLSPAMRDALLDRLRDKAKMLREMADYLEVITREPTGASELFETSPTSEAYHSPEEA
jgi:hypothetical protein